MTSTTPRRPALRLSILAAALFAAACTGDGGPSGDQPTSIAINGGNAQAVRYGNPVATPPSVVVTNAGGPMEGVTVTFTIAAGGGTVTGGTTTTDAQGIATVGGWTLGPTPGVNTLRATAGNISVNIGAAAVTGPPTTISLRSGSGQTWVQQSVLPTAPSVTVTDGQFPVPGARVNFAVTAGGGNIIGAVQHTDASGVAAAAGWRMGSTAVNTATATLQDAGAGPVTFTATAEPLVITAVNKVGGDNQTGFAGNFADQKPTLVVLNQFGQPTEGVPVALSVGGGGTISAASTTTSLNGQAQVPSWRYGPAGAQSITATAGAAAPLVFTATANAVPISNYRINIFYPTVSGVPQPSDAVKAVFTAAVTRWQSIIVGGLTPVTLSGSTVMGPYSVNTGVTGVGTIPCIPLVSNTTIKDINIYVYIRPIDGSSGTNILGLATPIYYREDASMLPVSGCMIFDTADVDQLLANGRLSSVILHEMAHVFGFGISDLWEEKELLLGKCPTSSTPSFVGQSSQQAFIAALLPAANFSDPIVPVEGEGTCSDGTRDGHWSESAMGNELMTGFLSQTNPLSAISSAALRDMGYTVNDVPSDPYTVPLGAAALRTGAAAPAGDRIHEMELDVPIILLDSRGAVTRVIER